MGFEAGFGTGGGPVASGLPADPVTVASAATVILGTRVVGDTADRFQILGDGRLAWSPGNAGVDIVMYRRTAGELITDTFLETKLDLYTRRDAATQIILGAAGPSAQSGISFQAGEAGSNLYRSAAGYMRSDGALGAAGLRVAEGANAKQGITAAMVGGTLVVANTSVTATSRIIVTRQDGGANPGAVYVSARVVGTSFTVTSTNAADTGTVAFQIFEPA